jgi:hypothetical protein
MIEQKIIITQNQREINELIDKGWKVISVVAGTVAIAHTQKGFISDDVVHGKFCVLFER